MAEHIAPVISLAAERARRQPLDAVTDALLPRLVLSGKRVPATEPTRCCNPRCAQPIEARDFVWVLQRDGQTFVGCSECGPSDFAEMVP